MLRRLLIVVGLAVLLMGCDSPLGSAPSTPTSMPTEIVLPTVPPATPTPNPEELASIIKKELEAEGIRVHKITLGTGVLPVLKVTYSHATTPSKDQMAELTAEIEQNFLVISKIVALHIEQGAPIKRIEFGLVLAADPSNPASIVRIGSEDIMDWHRGELSDSQYLLRFTR